MSLNDDVEPIRDAADQAEADPDEDEEDDFEDDDRPDDAVTCPFCDQTFPRKTCEACGGRRWLSPQAIEDILGSNQVPCLECEGWREAGGIGPSESLCGFCFGTTYM